MAIHIKTPQQLQDMNADLTAEYIIDNDIDMTDFVFTPIGIDDSFIGTLDGQGYTIKNLTVDGTNGNFFGIGLFADLAGDVQNVYMDNVRLIFSNVDYEVCGALAGYASHCTIDECHVTNLVILDDGNGGYMSNCGGFVGDANTVIFSNCTVQGTMTLNGSAFSYIGGFCGTYVRDGDFSNCHSNVDITLTGDGSGGVEVGGFIGDATDDNTVNISNCSSTGDITADNFNYFSVAGFCAGFWNVGLITNCYTSGDISCVNGGDGFGVGGFISNVQKGVNIRKCYSLCSVSFEGETDYGTGGFIGEAEQSGEIKDCYARGNVQSTVSEDCFGCGGFIGEAESVPTITNCYCTGTVQATAPVNKILNAGGFIGLVSSNLDVLNCYSVGVVTVVGSTVQGGGFIGSPGNPNFITVNILNCAWWTDAYTYAIGVSAPQWAAGISFHSGNLCWYNNMISGNGEVYQSLIEGNIGNNPASSPLAWQFVFDEDTRDMLGGEGTNETDKTTFFYKTHPVYAQV